METCRILITFKHNHLNGALYSKVCIQYKCVGYSLRVWQEDVTHEQIANFLQIRYLQIPSEHLWSHFATHTMNNKLCRPAG